MTLGPSPVDGIETIITIMLCELIAGGFLRWDRDKKMRSGCTMNSSVFFNGEYIECVLEVYTHAYIHNPLYQCFTKGFCGKKKKKKTRKDRLPYRVQLILPFNGISIKIFDQLKGNVWCMGRKFVLLSFQ